MTENQFEHLLQLLLDDDITTEQLDELTRLASADDEMVKQLRQHLAISDRLSQFENQLRSEDRFVDALKVRLKADGDTSRFLDKVLASTREDVSQEPPAPPHHENNWHTIRQRLCRMGHSGGRFGSTCGSRDPQQPAGSCRRGI
ncbi:hypothetical protein OAH18_03705 [bacterium]|nr:hypothetical protein [bacterium]